MRNGDFISKGSMNQHGYLEELNPVNTPVYVVNGNETFNERQAIKSNIYIPSNAKLTVKNVLNLLGNTTISIDNGGELIIDGGVITNANLSFTTGGKLEIKCGGKLVMRTNVTFNAPLGALVEINNGEIIKSCDF